MEPIENISAASDTRRLPSTRRLLLVAVLIPALVVASNRFLVESPAGASLRWLLYPWIIFTTAVLSWSAGRYLHPAWLCWILFVWCLALLDVLTFLACMNGRLEDQFGFILVSAQISLLVLWAVLGAMPWQWRLPAIAALVPLVVMFSDSFSGSNERS